MSAAETPVQVQAPLPQLQLMLAGGGLTVCSSMNPAHCKPGTVFAPWAKTSHRYEISHQSLARLIQQAAIRDLEASTRQELLLRLSSQAPTVLSQKALLELIDGLTESLEDKAYYALLDTLEQRQRTESGELVREQVQLDAGRDSHGSDIFRDFVSQSAKNSGQKTPRIAVVTASARDPFEAAEFYVQTLSQAGADVIWLPIDGAWQQATQARRCDILNLLGSQHNGYFDRMRVYPKLTEQQTVLCQEPGSLYSELEAIDGLFLSGGDQTLTLAAWLNADGTPSQALSILRSRFNAGNLVVGGTSAGTAVMASRAMITGGTSMGAIRYGISSQAPVSERCESQACQHKFPPETLTFRSAGGLGLYPFGIVDTHFSERQRQLRLVLLQDASRSGLALGVDENTALWLSNDGHYGEITGAAGVWFSEPQGKAGAIWQHRIHYLPAQSKLHLTEQKLIEVDVPVWTSGKCPNSATNSTGWLISPKYELNTDKHTTCDSRGYYRSLLLNTSG
ncbi:cyanophycinase [Shewanella cyperi]|uniref:Cyanophycinase n=1 Tax=Shewanella cyperi TaxID=2814292 RepID=A0A974XRK9_9GAMM|nr:cyanophycinase [Shewanella cyperi]QSX29199.1 cyanophycinase [Shewanella cyperi]